MKWGIRDIHEKDEIHEIIEDKTMKMGQFINFMTSMILVEILEKHT